MVNTPGGQDQASKITKLSIEPTNSGRTILELQNLCLNRGKTRILRNIFWQVRQGEHWAIIGANGSGKTSLLSAMMGYVTPTTGEILLLGRQYGRFDWRELRKKIGLVSSSMGRMMANDEPALETVISGKYAIIDFRGRPSANDRARATLLLKEIECAYAAERPWEVLSQGERQRILIGRALMGRPQLLILDEPCAGLDPAAREHFLQFLQRLSRGRSAPTLVLVTHHVEEIVPLFSHAMVLRAGEIIAAGKKAAVLDGKVLSRAFDCRIKVSKRGRRYELSVSSKRKVLI